MVANKQKLKTTNFLVTTVLKFALILGAQYCIYVCYLYFAYHQLQIVVGFESKLKKKEWYATLLEDVDRNNRLTSQPVFDLECQNLLLFFFKKA